MEDLGALNAGVMRRFERVVALPDPKVNEFPGRFQYVRLSSRSSPISAIE